VEPRIFESNGYVYMVGMVAPITPADAEIEELAFAQAIKESSPNQALLWLRGQYVEGDRPNRNGQTWSAEELAIKSLQPRLMPVTVMHDPRTAVGLIADTKLLTPDGDKVPRARIDTVLALWAHRFPEIAAECHANYAQGTLMQSMEAISTNYDCVECGQNFVKLPGGAERANWCTHLKGAVDSGVAPRRLLRDVTFTGTGLILGTRQGATGALDTAYLEMEVAEFHERAHHDATTRKTRRTSVDEITIKRSEYDELKATASRLAELSAKVTNLETAAARVPELERQLEALEISFKALTTERDAEKAAREKLEETARTAVLSTERVGKLGAAFTAALPETVKTRLGEQAKTMSDEDWTARLAELAELTKVQPDATAPAGTETFVQTETARTQLGGNAAGSTGAPSRSSVSSVLSGLARQTRRPAPATTTKPAGK